MPLLARSPPVVGLALATVAGASLFHSGAPFFLAPLPLLTLSLLKGLSYRPPLSSLGLSLALLAGWTLAQSGEDGLASDCRFQLEEGQSLHLDGWLAGPLSGGRGDFRPAEGGEGGCREPLRLVVPGARDNRWKPGSFLAVSGVWRKGRGSGSGSPLYSGYLRVDSLSVVSHLSKPFHRDALFRLGGWVQLKVEGLFPRTAGLASALIWARKEGLSPTVREAFARAGTAHLLAISGFHVGVVAGILFLLSGFLGLSHKTRFFLCSSGVWGYVLAIGAPDAALRAALLLSLLSAGRWLNRSVATLGALASALILLLVQDPISLTRPGFQLSFSGALGLAVGYRPLARWISGWGKGWIPLSICQGLGAGIAATLATLPLVAWHFGRVSLIGVPMTLLVTPLVALSIPGIFLCLLLSVIHTGVAQALALGVDELLLFFLRLVQTAGSLPFASMWISEGMVVSCMAALLLGGVLMVAWSGEGPGRWGGLLPTLLLAGVLLGSPLRRLAQLGTMEIVVLDVGQGDATLLRSPGGRWVLVDAGPRAMDFDAGERIILPYLRRRGVDALEVVVLTHPDMDHVGGATALLNEVDVGAVLDPGASAGTDAFLQVLEAASKLGIPWQEGRAGDSLNLDGMALRILAPQRGDGVWTDNNDASLVLEVKLGEFTALLTGDAPKESEVQFLPLVMASQIQVLKVGHHGSSTSTANELLEELHPEVALISVGRGNRFGHPTPEILRRLRGHGVRVHRTDLEGHLVVQVRRDGTYVIVPTRS